MPVGPNAHKVPPPWLIAMQRYGPPPSYPNLKIPGLNAPIPDGCSFGYHVSAFFKFRYSFFQIFLSVFLPYFYSDLLSSGGMGQKYIFSLFCRFILISFF